MKNKFAFGIGIVVALVLLVYMFCFQVRYDQVAVLTTFDKPSSIKTDPGLYFKLPWPIQKEKKYETRIQVLEDQLEEIQTADGNVVIVRTYLAWRVSDPLKFFNNVETIEGAKPKLNPLLRADVQGIISKYRFDQLVNTDASRLKLGEIEAQAVAQMVSRLESQGYGIEPVKIGIRRILLPESVTEGVFTRMKETRERMAERARSEGSGRAAGIRSEARSASDRILAFAERTAQAIRAKGDAEAASHYSTFAQDESFAIFLRQIEALKLMLPNNTTFVLDADTIEVLDLFRRPPQAIPQPHVRAAETLAQPQAR